MVCVGVPNHRTTRLWRCLVFSLVVLFLCLSPGCFPAAAEESVMPAAPNDDRMGAVLLVNLENNLTLCEKDADRKVYPSSTVKIMTGLLACRFLAGRLDEAVTVTGAMVSGVTGRSMHLADGEVLTVRDLLYAAICGSYNDAACVLACLVSGSVAAFVSDMNTEAARLGAVSTVYTNPTGLHDPSMSTSARDLALLSREAYANELYMTIASERSYSIPATNASPERIFSNRNALISDSSQNYFNGSCRGMNVGMTDEGGWSLVTVSEKGGAHNLCILLGGAEAAEDELIPIYLYANRLFAWAHQNYRYRTVLTAGDAVETVSVGMTGISTSETRTVAATDLKVYLPAHVDVATLTITTAYEGDELVAPLTAGQIVGIASVTYEGRVIGRADLAVTEDFARNGFLDGMMAFRTYLCSRAFLITVPVFLALLIPFLRMTAVRGGRYGIRSARRKKIRYIKRRF